jgi:hypothetical protein
MAVQASGRGARASRLFFSPQPALQLNHEIERVRIESARRLLAAAELKKDLDGQIARHRGSGRFLTD